MSEKLFVGTTIPQANSEQTTDLNETDLISNTLKDKSLIIVLLTFFDTLCVSYDSYFIFDYC
jgi:hypothetical protein